MGRWSNTYFSDGKIAIEFWIKSARKDRTPTMFGDAPNVCD